MFYSEGDSGWCASKVCGARGGGSGERGRRVEVCVWVCVVGSEQCVRCYLCLCDLVYLWGSL
jgi:hypothetical protein